MGDSKSVERGLEAIDLYVLFRTWSDLGFVGFRDDFYNKVTGKSAAQMKAYWSKIIFTGKANHPRKLQTTLP